MSAGRQNLTGVWQGRYFYQARLAPVSFVATLIEAGSHLGGTTHEPGGSIGLNGSMAYASLAGSRDGAHVSFTKTYDGSAGEHPPINYQGALNADATEIVGTWSIPGIWNGTFQMIRDTGKTVARKRRTAIRASLQTP